MILRIGFQERVSLYLVGFWAKGIHMKSLGALQVLLSSLSGSTYLHKRNTKTPPNL